MRSIFLLCLIVAVNPTFSQGIKALQPGHWRAEIAMNDRLFIPFFLDISKNKNQILLEVVNADERIILRDISVKNDSVYAHFPEMDAQIVFQVSEKGNELRGYWINFARKEPIKIPLNAYISTENIERISFSAAGNSNANQNLTGKWDVTFNPKAKPRKAIGSFEVKNTKVTGTFLTETGDYRFLEGNMNGNEFALSSFNGSWAFYFTGTISGDSIQGKYYSGVSFSTDWIASKNEQAKLREHEELTYVINDAAFNFKELEELNGKPFSFPGKKYKDKVVIFQIMGTWCPNCIDEINYFKTLYANYNKQGLEIVALAYEVGEDKKAQIKKLKAFKKRTGIPYKVVLAGTSKTEVAARHFPMVNGVMSFPTTIFVDKKGKIQKIFTGFSGPATGNAYKEIKDEIQYEVEELLDLLK